MSEKGSKSLIPDTVPLLKERKGGVADVIFVSLLLEASRMVDDGIDIPGIEGAAKKAFDIPKGFLSQMDDTGIDATVSRMYSLSDSSDPDDPIYQVYNNFFTPSESCKEMLEKYNQAKDKSSVKWVSEEDSRKEPKDFMLVDLLERRFLGVAFMTATEVVNAGVVKLEDVDKLCKNALRWKEGPYSLMNKIGIRGVMRIVTEKMVLSHRKEINFPIPRLLISQAQKDQPWPLTGN
jgi:enoyl-CoA hydratase/3-hydroxyacyl-CoA dehydrogenase